jgi:hypothetical protein
VISKGTDQLVGEMETAADAPSVVGEASGGGGQRGRSGAVGR